MVQYDKNTTDTSVLVVHSSGDSTKQQRSHNMLSPSSHNKEKSTKLDTEKTSIQQMLKIRADARIGETLKRITAMQEKELLTTGNLKLQGVGVKAGRIALVCAQNKGEITDILIEPYTLPNNVETMRVSITLSLKSSGTVDHPYAHTSWRVCVPRGSQSMSSSCRALDKRLDSIQVGQLIKISAAGGALETLLVFMHCVNQEYSEYCTITSYSVQNVVLHNNTTGRANKKTLMDVWIRKDRDWSDNENSV